MAKKGLTQPTGKTSVKPMPSVPKTPRMTHK